MFLWWKTVGITFKDKFDLQAVSYVGAFSISKFKIALFAQNTDIQHIFTLYKEHDKSKLKLKFRDIKNYFGQRWS
jgi:hypothetical protein